MKSPESGVHTDPHALEEYDQNELGMVPSLVDGTTVVVIGAGLKTVDMRQTLRKGKIIPIFSPQLHEAIAQRLERKEQVILFLNRRGYSTALQCPRCGFVAGCP